jgi:hypothetical protein
MVSGLNFILLIVSRIICQGDVSCSSMVNEVNVNKPFLLLHNFIFTLLNTELSEKQITECTC